MKLSLHFCIKYKNLSDLFPFSIIQGKKIWTFMKYSITEMSLKTFQSLEVWHSFNKAIKDH